MKKITVIVPCLNEEDALPIYYKEMSKIMKQMKETEIELLFVDDGSTDRTLSVMKDLHELDGRCHYLSFSRNFGKEAAIYAGLQNADGDYMAIMDVDLQDPPALLPKMYRILEEEGYDSVATKRSTRTGEPKIRSFLSKSFYNVINRLSKTEIVNGARDYRLMKRNMVDAVLSMSEYNRFSKGIFEWVGFRTKWLEFENHERSAGETKWSMKKLFCYSLEGITGFLCLGHGNCILYSLLSYDRRDHFSYADLGRSGFRLAVSCVHHLFCRRDPASLHRDRRAISLQNLSGDKTPPDLYYKRQQ